MRSSRLTCMSALAIVCVACFGDDGVGPAETLAHSAAMASCGPADEVAVAIYLAHVPITSWNPSAPYVRIVLSGNVDGLEGSSWVLEESDLHRWIGASYYPNSGEHENATRGTVIIDEVSETNSITGSVDLTFPETGQIRTEFDADWIPTGMLCG